MARKYIYLDQKHMVTLFCISYLICLISTEGALRLPTTYDNHEPIQPIPSLSSVRHIALNELNRPKIDLSWPPMTSNDWLLSANRNQLCSRVPIIMIYQRNKVFPPYSVIKKKTKLLFLIVAWSSSDFISCFRVLSTIWFGSLITETRYLLEGTPGVFSLHNILIPDDLQWAT